MKALDYIRIALAIETLAYYDKNYLDRVYAGSPAKTSKLLQELLRAAEADIVKRMESPTAAQT